MSNTEHTRRSRHSHQPTVVAEQLVDNDVVRDNPADPVEERECLEYVPGEEIPARRAEEGVEEEPFTADTPTVTHTGIHLGVQGVEEGACHEVGGPD